MKRNVITYFLLFNVIFLSCKKAEEVTEFTGNETKYQLVQASNYPISGTATVKERKDGSVSFVIELKGTQGDSKFPVHLHLGDLSTPKADVAALLSPVTAGNGKSETVLNKLANETPITYKQVISMNACLKIHLSDVGVERDVVLAGGNIGKASTNSISSGRVGIADCKSQ
jgi:hypothetical protein